MSLLTKDSIEKDDKALGFEGAIDIAGFEVATGLDVLLKLLMMIFLMLT